VVALQLLRAWLSNRRSSCRADQGAVDIETLKLKTELPHGLNATNVPFGAAKT
jgi:hypothetical protein